MVAILNLQLRLLKALAGGEGNARARRHPVAGGQNGADGAFPADGHAAVDAAITLHHGEGIVARHKTQHTVAVLVRKGPAEGIDGGDPNAGVILRRVGIACLICEPHAEALAALRRLIGLHRAHDPIGKALSVAVAGSRKAGQRRVIFVLRRAADIRRLIQIVRHGGDQRHAALAEEVLLLREAEIADLRRRAVHIVAAIFIGAHKIAVHAVDLVHPAAFYAGKAVAAGLERLQDRLAGLIAYFFRRCNDLPVCACGKIEPAAFVCGQRRARHKAQQKNKRHGQRQRPFQRVLFHLRFTLSI